MRCIFYILIEILFKFVRFWWNVTKLMTKFIALSNKIMCSNSGGMPWLNFVCDLYWKSSAFEVPFLPWSLNVQHLHTCGKNYIIILETTISSMQSTSKIASSMTNKLVTDCTQSDIISGIPVKIFCKIVVVCLSKELSW